MVKYVVFRGSVFFPICLLVERFAVKSRMINIHNLGHPKAVGIFMTHIKQIQSNSHLTLEWCRKV